MPRIGETELPGGFERAADPGVEAVAPSATGVEPAGVGLELPNTRPGGHALGGHSREFRQEPVRGYLLLVHLKGKSAEGREVRVLIATGRGWAVCSPQGVEAVGLTEVACELPESGAWLPNRWG